MFLKKLTPFLNKKIKNYNLEKTLLKKLSKDEITLNVFPLFLLELIQKYVRLQAEGLENVPKKGPALIIPNHSGFTALDACILSYELYKRKARIPRILAHRFFFIHPKIKAMVSKMGIAKATTENGLYYLKKKNIVILFPEGERGNFKPTKQKYKLQEFKRGFVRMAILTKTPIIPTIIIGAEETHINLGQIELSKYLKGLVIPLPLNIIPLPAKWKIIFLPPIYLTEYSKKDVENSKKMRAVSERIKKTIQERIDEEVSKRKFVFLS